MKARMSIFYTHNEIVSGRPSWRSDGTSVVFTNSCCDILDPGHIRLLEGARALRDTLVGLSTTDMAERVFSHPQAEAAGTFSEETKEPQYSQ